MSCLSFSSSRFSFGCSRSLALTLVLAGAWLVSTGAMAGPLQSKAPRLYVNYAPQPPLADLLAHTVCLLDAGCETDFGLGQGMGHLYLARLTPLAVTAGSAAAERAQAAGLVRTESGKGWDRLLLDPLKSGWRAEVIEGQALAAAKRGFDGFVIEGAQELAELAALDPALKAARQKQFTTMVRELRRRFPDKRLVLHRGWELLSETHDVLYGLFFDGLFRQRDAAGRSQAVSETAAAREEKNVRVAQTLGLKVLVAEPGEAMAARLNEEAAERLQRIGCAVVVTGGQGEKEVLGPHLPEARTVLVLHGWDAAQEGVAVKPVEQTWAARELEPALKWLGLEPRYLSVTAWREALAEGALPAVTRLAGVLVDADCVVPAGAQEALAGWLLSAVEAGTPLLLGSQPLTTAAAWDRLSGGLGLQGDGQEIDAAGTLALSGYRADWFPAGRFPEQRALRGVDLQAPAGAERVLSYRRVLASGEARRCDVVFTASWGGAWLARCAGAPVEAFRWAETALRRHEAGPVPDTTTVAGRRVFLSTVQGRGFCEPSWLPGGRLCAEVLRDELAEVPNLPVTVAVAEADIRGWSEASEPSESGRYEVLARALFSLPQVEPAANTMSRPQNWVTDAFVAGPLRPGVPENRFDAGREIAGSLDFVRRRLLPPGKSAAFLLWPEGSAPGAEAMQRVRAEGGWHLPESWRPGWSLGGEESAATVEVAPGPPDSAEAMAQAWIDQQGGGDAARRTGPAHLAYAFGDLKKTTNVEALRRIWSWCAEQAWHPMTAAGYARFLEDAASCRIDRVGRDHWRVISTGRALTLRLPAGRGRPDLTRSRGVAGYREHAGQLYLYLSGREVSEVVLRPAEELAPHLHLVEADRLVDFHHLEREQARFRVQGRDAAVVVLGGLKAEAWYLVEASGVKTRLQTDAAGRLALQAPALATIQLQPVPGEGRSYAAR